MATNGIHSRPSSRFGVFLLALPFALFVQGHTAYAATISVNTTDDNLTSDGNCSLREAIQAANMDVAVDACTAGSGADRIVVPAGAYALSIAGAGEDENATGDLDITADLTITGAGAATTIVDGAGLDRVFHIDPAGVGVTAELSGVTVENGLAAGAFFTLGGGILNGGTLTLNNSAVRNNTGVTLDVFGGGIFNAGTMTLNDSTVNDNTAVSGGGIRNAGTLALKRSTVSGNSSGASGGGIANTGTLTIENSIVSGNTGFFGGGIDNFIAGTLSSASSTVTGNSAVFGGGIVNSGLLTLKNTIVGKNSASGSGGDCAGTPASAGNNLDSDQSCGLAGPGDISGVDPRLGPLADNGGPTKTHALLGGSLAINAGSGDCPPPFTDQRGVARSQGAACDIGSFERVLPLAAAIDIKPGSFSNSINPESAGVIPVALLTTATLDATSVDVGTVAFGPTGTEATPVRSSFEDVDRDGDTDVVFHFSTQAARIECGDASALLTGVTSGGQMIEGADSIQTVGC